MASQEVNNTALEVVDSEQQKHWAEMAELIKKTAQQRRRERTPKAKIKSRSGGGEKTYKYVDRADYQIWLDDHFPGWTVEEYKTWTVNITTPTQTAPALFCASFMLVVIESGLTKRRIPCVGAAATSSSELSRDNATLLKQKLNSATTECYKMGCNWLGAFFDLRADDEGREKAARPANDEQFAKFKVLLDKVPSQHKGAVTKSWNEMVESTADEFLKGLEEKLNKPKE